MKIEDYRQIIIEFIEYIPDDIESCLRKTIIEKCSGNVTVRTEESEENFIYKESRYKIYAQLLEGKARLDIAGNVYGFTQGSGFMIPAFNPVTIRSREEFKMILSIIKGENSLLLKPLD